MTTRYFKLAREDGTTIHGRPMWPQGEWQRVTGPLVPCENGLHVVTVEQALEWWISPNMVVWDVEIDPRYKPVEEWNKTVVRRARAVSLTAWRPEDNYRLAADIAEHVLHVYEDRFPGDDRPRRAIEATRTYAEAPATEAAWAAKAAWAAGADAAAAARAAMVVGAVRAARAAWAARVTWVTEAAKAAKDAEAAERAWQVERLLAYLDGTVER